jgi:hypothetical protein
MIYFRQTVLDKIKSASNEKEIESLIEHSIQRLKSKNVNGHLIQRYIHAMGTTLYNAKLEHSSKNTQLNLDVAIILFRKLHRP